MVPFASPAVTLFEFGSYNAGGSNRMVGLHHEAQIMNQSNHMLGRFSAADADPDASTWVDKVTGQTVTITRSTSGDKMALVGSATWLFGGAERLVVPHSALLDLDVSEGLTVVLRVRSHSGGGDWGRIVAKNNTVTDDGWYLGKSASGPRIYAHMNDSVATVDVGEGVDNATYGDVATVVAVWDASGSEIYIDGVSDDSDSTVLADFSEVQDLAIGAAIDGGNPAVVEVMAVAVFNSGLNSDEVLKVHNELAGVVDDGSLAAEDVSFVPAGSIAAVNVQAAIEELDSENDHFTVCTAATRPASPSVGDSIYETDTLRSRTWDGTYWLEMDGPVYDWTPTINGGLTLGNGNLKGKYFLRGWTLHWWIYCLWGTTTSGTTQQFNTPGTMVIDAQATAFYMGGTAIARESGVSWYNGLFVSYDAADDILNTTTFFANTPMSATVPHTWGSADSLALSGVFPMTDVDAPTS